MDWNDLRHFLALARQGSVRGAGALLGVSHSTVARRVEALEQQLCTRLFDRDRDGYQLTEAGQQLLPGAERVEAEMASLQRDLAGQDDRLAGQICLTCCDEYVSDMMMGALASFCETYPEIELSLFADSRPFDLSKREADVAIRMLRVNTSPPEHLIGTKLVPMVVANYVARSHADRLNPESPGNEARWIAYDDRRSLTHMLGDSGYPDLDMWGCFSTLGLMVQATRQGLGVAMLPCYVADRDPALQRLPNPGLRHLADLWMLSHPDLRKNTRLKLARTCVAAAIREYEPLFRGESYTGP